MIFNIQKFSTNDGPGIRTVVFFKGCPLRCKWCANPESQRFSVDVLWNADQCLHCGRCASLCPKGAVAIAPEGKVTVNAELCSGCGVCVSQCPARALTMEGEEKSIRDILFVCLQDREFYEESGGGVTLSGGEALAAEEALPLLKALKENGISTAVETCGFISGNVIAQAAEFTDLFLFDIKHWDEQKHSEGTGVSNSLPLKNMKMLLSEGRNVLPRMPVIPGYNDSPDDARGIARRLKECGADRLQLLPYHSFGERKYTLLGKEYDYEGHPSTREEQLEDFRQILISAGIDAFF